MTIKRFPAYLRDMQEEIEGYAKGFGLDFYPILYEVLVTLPLVVPTRRTRDCSRENGTDLARERDKVGRLGDDTDGVCRLPRG